MIFQFLLGCYFKAAWTVATTFFALFQFLLGCYIKEKKTGGFEIDIFQFLLGCYTIKLSSPPPKIAGLSIPFRMLPI